MKEIKYSCCFSVLGTSTGVCPLIQTTIRNSSLTNIFEITIDQSNLKPFLPFCMLSVIGEKVK